jgi:alpha-1,6-mannosyltransferase
MDLPTTLHLTNAYHATSGGIRTFYDALLASASSQRRFMHLVVPADADRTDELDRWTTIHRVRAARSPWFDRRYRLLRPDHYWSRRSPVGRILSVVRPDLVEVCDKYTLSHVGRLLRAGWYWRGHRPTVVGLSCERMDDNVAAYLPGGRYLVRAAHAYLRVLYAPAFDVHVANSRYTADELLTGAGLDAVEVRGMGVDADLFAAARPDPTLRQTLLTAAGGRPDSALVLYVGRVSPEKQIDPLVHAVGGLGRRAGVPDMRLVVVGDGPSLPALRRLAARVAPGRVVFAGTISDRTELARVYASADVFVHTNPREPFGIAPLEAMAAGVPVVVPGSGGVLSYAHDRNAWLVEPTPDGFADGILQVVGNRDAGRLARARWTALDHAWPLMAQRYFDTLDALHARRVTMPGPTVAATSAAPSRV